MVAIPNRCAIAVRQMYPYKLKSTVHNQSADLRSGKQNPSHTVRHRGLGNE
jgi:hypothetical protein